MKTNLTYDELKETVLNRGYNIFVYDNRNIPEYFENNNNPKTEVTKFDSVKFIDYQRAIVFHDSHNTNILCFKNIDHSELIEDDCATWNELMISCMGIDKKTHEYIIICN